MRTIKGYNGRYLVTEDGRVFSSNGRFKELRQATTNGYKKVTLCGEGKRYFRFVHQLVAETYLDNPHNYKEVNHKNEIKSDNRVENLEWCSREYNVEYSCAVSIALRSPAGDLVNIFNITKFCKENGLNNGGIYHLKTGRLKSVKGWRLP